MQVAITVVPAIEADFWTALAASWTASAVATLLAWLATAGSDDALDTTLLTRLRRPVNVPDPDIPGMLFAAALPVNPLLRLVPLTRPSSHARDPGPATRTASGSPKRGETPM